MEEKQHIEKADVGRLEDVLGSGDPLIQKTPAASGDWREMECSNHPGMRRADCGCLSNAEIRDVLFDISVQLKAWLAHAHATGSLHVAIPCDVADKILSLVEARESKHAESESTALVQSIREIADELKILRREVDRKKEADAIRHAIETGESVQPPAHAPEAHNETCPKCGEEWCLHFVHDGRLDCPAPAISLSAIETESKTLQTADKFLTLLWREMRNNRSELIVARAMGALTALLACGLITTLEVTQWTYCFDRCPGHEDEGGRSWCAYCGNL